MNDGGSTNGGSNNIGESHSVELAMGDDDVMVPRRVEENYTYAGNQPSSSHFHHEQLQHHPHQQPQQPQPPQNDRDGFHGYSDFNLHTEMLQLYGDNEHEPQPEPRLPRPSTGIRYVEPPIWQSMQPTTHQPIYQLINQSITLTT